MSPESEKDRVLEEKGSEIAGLLPERTYTSDLIWAVQGGRKWLRSKS